jgi:hypothetical protein
MCRDDNVHSELDSLGQPGLIRAICGRDLFSIEARQMLDV